MSSIQDIREWGRQQEEWSDVPNKGRLPKGLRTAYMDAHPDEAMKNARTTLGMDDNPYQTFDNVTLVDETKPKQEPTTREKIRTAVAKRKTPAAPKKAKPRMSVDRLVQRIWEFGARMVGPVNPYVSRVIAYQAPVAGIILEPAIKDTVVDKLLQPIARTEKGAETLFALLGPPLLVGVVTYRPSSAPLVLPVLRESLAVMIEVCGPAMEQVKQRQEEWEQKYGTDVDKLLEALLAPIEDDDVQTQSGG